MDGGGFDKLAQIAKQHITSAQYIIGPKRHLSMLPSCDASLIEWPSPFSKGIEILLSRRGQPCVMLTSGDPFWFGAGTNITSNLTPGEWRAIPNHSCFSLCAAELGWALDQTLCIGLHAAPFSRLRPYLAPNRRIMATMRDGKSVNELANYLCRIGFGNTQITILESLGSTNQKITKSCASDLEEEFMHPVMVALDISGDGETIQSSSGIPDSWFKHDGQITKQAVRAFTLSSLAPRSGEHLWDLGAGSGSIGIEWLLSGPFMRATAVEKNSERVNTIKKNALNLGVDQLIVVESNINDAIYDLEKPDCIFIGGGLNEDLIQLLWSHIGDGTRVVANGVTIETDRLLTSLQGKFGGRVQRLEISHLEKIGNMHGWKASFPITQWVTIKGKY
jgi:precorrin-6Y C5,15-methyltransferase (decarboxylating)